MYTTSMELASGVFIFSSLLCALVYRAIADKQHKKYFLIAVSLALYIYLANIVFVLIFLGLVLLSFVAGRSGWLTRTPVFVSVVALHFLPLVLYKYLFFLCTLSQQWTAWSCKETHWLLPLGISYVTFSLVATLVDIRRRTFRVGAFADFVFYGVWYPKLFVGPIVRGGDMLTGSGTFQPQSVSWTKVEEASRLIILGISKKVVVASGLSGWINYSFTHITSLSGIESLLSTLAYAIVIYCDFSGIVDIIRGLSMLFGIILPLNFDFPYFSTSIRDFWRRWHISLMRFFRDYVYIPLGGNRVSLPLHVLNITIVFFLTGWWHGATQPFLVWGLLHALAVSISILFTSISKNISFSVHPFLRYILTATSMVLTFCFVSAAWVFFRVSDVSDGAILLTNILMSTPWYLEIKNMESYFLYHIYLYQAIASGCIGVMIILVEKQYLSSRHGAVVFTGSVVLLFLAFVFSSFFQYAQPITIYTRF